MAAARFAYEQACRAAENAHLDARSAEARADAVVLPAPRDPEGEAVLALANADYHRALAAREAARQAVQEALAQLMAAMSAARRVRPVKPSKGR
ncbi:hypothetical protein OR16_04622 [Cupriavidus basilensis OR16]|uniref:Uncharacterized protein n=1 Tax=Cupriavidus basilensis OR16 TaxID=1127483 RepID=H1S016_9BURK|nr:hypothetical protein [Cupriavidus basilensis]EHP44232.1 hypothetical protein OR16_04622 [Cupriavidus basilensis OR16]